MMAKAEARRQKPKRGIRDSKPAQKSSSGWSVSRLLVRIVGALFVAAVAYMLLCSVCLVLLRWIDPWFTGVQAQRRIESWFDAGKSYTKHRTQVPLESISSDLRHGIIAAEDTKFYQHEGIDWEAIEDLIDDDLEKMKESKRGGSTITQQLVKNLFFTTHRSWIRKGFEFILTPLADKILSKDRVLELYLNNIEWGPGVFGAEAAGRFHYGVSAGRLTRDQAARLVSIVPSPRRWRPQQMGRRAAVIQARMRQMGW